jgi:hypothetical protein
LATTCIFCGTTGTMTAEHVLPNWLSKIGLTEDPRVSSASSWLNRSPQFRGTGKPFQIKIKSVCTTCNSGWMNDLEEVARPVLTPIILGSHAFISEKDQPKLALWALKTALVATMVSSATDRAEGYGVPSDEFLAVFGRARQLSPPRHVQVWIGRFNGQNHLASVQTTPMAVLEQGLAEPVGPSAYVFSVLLGEMFLQGIRFVQPGTQLHLETGHGFTQIWPVNGRVEWPYGDSVTDADLRQTQKGLNLHAVQPSLRVLPFGPTVDLPRSTAKGRTVKLPAPCGAHYVYYPISLAERAETGAFFAFVATCECPKTYLIHTHKNGVKFKGEGPIEFVQRQYDELPGKPIKISLPGFRFFCKPL